MLPGTDPAPMPPTEDLAALFRRNLDRNYGCKVFFAGVPVLGIRIPRERAGMITPEDASRVKSSILSTDGRSCTSMCLRH